MWLFCSRSRLLLVNFFVCQSVTIVTLVTMAQQYVDKTNEEMSLLNMGECYVTFFCDDMMVLCIITSLGALNLVWIGLGFLGLNSRLKG